MKGTLIVDLIGRALGLGRPPIQGPGATPPDRSE